MINNFESKTCCSVCHSKKRKLFFGINNVPVLTCAIWSTKDEALACKKKDILLAFCHDCGFIENILFDANITEYGSYYENALHFSDIYRLYSQKEAAKLVKKLNLKRKKIMDIGCGDGHFISLLCDLGKNEGIGFDPSYSFVKKNIDDLSPAVHIIPEYYSDKYSYFSNDLIIARHTLEHIACPDHFIKMIRNALKKQQTYLFFEVPNSCYLLNNVNLWDIIYEHCSYFTVSSLYNLFYLNEFSIKSIRQTYKKQYLSILAAPVNNSKTIKHNYNALILKMYKQIKQFSYLAKERLKENRNMLLMYREQKKRIALWGAGAKSVIFLNMVKVDDAIGHVIDINPRKQGYFIPGSGHRIDAPEKLKAFQPDLVLVMNPIYRNEITKTLSDLGIKADIQVV